MGKNKLTRENKTLLKLIAIVLAIVLPMAFLMPGRAYAYTQVEQVVNVGHGSLNPSYLVIHETSNPGASAANHVKLYSRGYSYAVHYVMELDGSKVYHTMYDNRLSWSVGNGNSHVVSIELAHATNKTDFNNQWNEAVKWAGDYLKKRGWTIDKMISHNEARLKWGGTSHTDPNGYFESYGKSWSQFKAAVAAYMGGSKAYSNNTNTYTNSPAQKVTTQAGNYSVGTYHTTTTLNVRTGAGTNYALVGYWNMTANARANAQYGHSSLNPNTTVTVSQVKNGWGKIPSGWVSMQYLASGAAKTTAKATTSTQSVSKATYSLGTYRVTADALNVRYGAGTGYAKVAYRNLTTNAKAHAYSNGCLKRGTYVTVSQAKNGFGKIPSGWVSMSWLARV